LHSSFVIGLTDDRDTAFGAMWHLKMNGMMLNDEFVCNRNRLCLDSVLAEVAKMSLKWLS